MHRTADDRLDLRRFSPALRVFMVVLWAFWTVVMFTFARVHAVAYLLGAMCAWTTLYWIRVPAVVASVRSDGFTWVDQWWSMFLVFPEHAAAWTDVARVDTRETASHGQRYLWTAVGVRNAETGGLRGFVVTSRDAGYAQFIDLLAAHTSGLPIQTSGLGVEATRVRQAMHRIPASRMHVFGTVMAIVSVLAAVVMITRR